MHDHEHNHSHNHSHDHSHNHDLDNKKDNSDIDKLKILVPHWIKHNNEHIKDHEKWLKIAKESEKKEIAGELKEVIHLLKTVNTHLESAGKKLG